ncbi:hypothetical protein L2E69_19480 [Planktothrix agardhii 1806]|uniref:hypothetical protein n=1 Tax=Planktothrix agardhii TaxID=1160 RepID=UPI001F220010|nr:hypothetical protein [Planktothrix agardhii]MCF3600988.1 hypothetical protein [Planktothrix agardhii 1804]MCF3618103.1 hypothetical protein [Planktothrix agardhii 1806]
MKYKNIREEELKNKVGADWFKQFDTTEILGNIDFTVFPKNDSLFGRTPLLWAEAKTGNFDVPTMFVQLILTIGKARTFDKTLPPAFLGAFDFKKIAFVEYSNVQDIFYLNDFNWNVTPSNHETKEFRLIKERIESTLKENTYVFDFEKDDKELRTFIKDNIANATTISKIKIDKNNFIPIYLRWIETVKPIINVNWEELKKANILDSDFYLADLFVDDKDTQNIEDDSSIRDNLFVVFQNQGYKIAKENLKQMFDATINIKNKDIYSQFWKLYKRPPLKEFQDYIIERRDLLTPQDIRERKGAFFTPRIWVELSQKYLTDYLGENWQDDYTIWDCAAGTGNLLAGLTNKYNIYASTLDQADVNVMHERIEHGANLLKNHVFQFDFLNDDFTKLPQSLQDIINDEEKRKKLIVYINPPYAESGDSKQRMGTGKNKANVASETKVYNVYSEKFGTATRELFTQFLIRINSEIPNSIIANFSTLKFVQSQNFEKFRNLFKASFKSGFLVPANTFDNVKGKFPIGFYIWNLNEAKDIEAFLIDLYDVNGYLGEKLIHTHKKGTFLIDWLRNFYDKKGEILGYLRVNGPDVQNNIGVFITSHPTENDLKKHFVYGITIKNIIQMSIYLAVRLSIKATWLNDRDQFLFPKDNFNNDKEFENDCLTFTLFNNNISSKENTNHWIPFTEQEVNAQNKFESHFMTDFINGKIKVEEEVSLFGSASSPNQKREFSAEAKAVFDAGRELWKYYHSKPNVNVNASLYDIREYFQDRNDKGRMNSKSDDEKYMELIGELRNKLNFLADKIKPKIYEYEFLKE